MSAAHSEVVLVLRTSVGCLRLAVALLQEQTDDAERAETLDVIERQAGEAEAAAAALAVLGGE